MHYHRYGRSKIQDAIEQLDAARFASRRRAEEELEGSYIKFKEIKNKINSALAEWNR